jgi:hypothetical protein
MRTWAGSIAVAAIAVASAVVLDAQQGNPPLTAADRAEIQQLAARYATALATCASDEYASLFTPDGVFISDDFRGPTHRKMYGPNGGRLEGRARLKELVDTEEHCLKPDPARANAAARNPPSVVIVPSPEGAKGTISLANNGRYEDVYVKTPEGWRFKVRRVVMPPQPAAPAPVR